LKLICHSKGVADSEAIAGLTLDRLELHDIGLPAGASASGIKQLALTNPCWEDLQVAMSPTFSPDLKVLPLTSSGNKTAQSPGA